MYIISHRGNINGPAKELENNQDHINTLLKLTPFHIEIDLWYSTINDNHTNYFLVGHDKPDKLLKINMSDCARVLYHCKNKKCLEKLNENWHGDSMHYFWHEEDKYTLTSKGKIIVYPGKEILKDSIVMLPEKGNYSLSELKLASAVCTDYPFKYWSMLCN